MSKDRNQKARENYKKLREAGLSSKEAASKRYSSPEKIKAAIKESKARQRQAQARENYARLKEAGFTAKEAERYRYSSPEKIEAAIKEKTLPPVQQKKRGRAKIKKTQKEFNSSSLREIHLKGISNHEINKAMQEKERAISDGFKFANIAVNFTYTTGQDQFFSSPLKPIREQWDSGEELYTEIEDIIENFGDYYSPIGTIAPVITIIIRFWRPK